MIRRANLPAVAALGLLLTACGTIDPAPLDDFDLYKWDLDAVREMAPQGPAFVRGLRAGYLDLVDRADAGGDGSKDHFVRKAVDSARGLNVQPDMPGLYAFEAEGEEFAAARARLTSALDATARRKAPLEASQAQVAYDCWMEETDDGDQEGAASCKALFERSIAAAEDALTTNLDNVYIVFFAFDQSVITPVANAVLDDVAQDFRDGEASKIVLAGHADTSGPDAYNLALSERRARTVAAALEDKGVGQDALDIMWYGETQPRIATGDGVREPQNRRVEIEFAE